MSGTMRETRGEIKPQRVYRDYRDYMGRLYYVENISEGFIDKEKIVVFRECFPPYRIYHLPYEIFAETLPQSMREECLIKYGTMPQYRFEELTY